MHYSTKDNINDLIDIIKHNKSILYIGKQDNIYKLLKVSNQNIVFLDYKKIYQNQFSEKVDIINNLNDKNNFETVIASDEIINVSDDLAYSLVNQICLISENVILLHSKNTNERKTIDFWSKIFAKENFIRNLSTMNSYFSLYNKYDIKNISVVKLIEYYEKSIDSINTKYADYDKIKTENEKNLYDKKYYYTINKDLSSDLEYANLQNKQLKESNEHLNSMCATTINNYNAVINSRWWKVTKPGRYITSKIRKLPGMGSLIIALRIIKSDGISGLKEKVKYKKQLYKLIKKNSILISNFIPAKLAVKQLNTTFEKDITFSILVPLFNTPAQYLREMIDSCINQTYQKWELCLADASNDANGEVFKICNSYMKKDKRIKYKKIQNISISDNTNEAIKMATGSYISLLDHDDFLHPSALYENMLAITKKDADFIYTDEMTIDKDIFNPLVIHLKQDFAPDTLRANNYICHFSTFSKELLDKVGYFNPECNGSQDYDIILRLTEQAKSIVHIPKILYYWRYHENSVASDVTAKPYCITSAIRALDDHLKRMNIEGSAEHIKNTPGFYKINYKIIGNPLISIIIPNKDAIEYLSVLIKSIINKSTYKNYEIIIVENNSINPKTFDYYKDIQEQYENIKVVTWKHEFNYSAINNFGVSFASGDYYLLLNNDMEVISENWIEEMLMYAQREDIGIVGAKLYYEDDTIQHAGICIGAGGIAGHFHINHPKDSPGYMGRLIFAHNVSAVTGACMLMKKSVYNEVNGLDVAFQVAFNDVDFCLRVRQAGYLNIFTPFAELYHYESKSRGNDLNPKNFKRFKSEIEYFEKKWFDVLQKTDPYYNPNFNINIANFTFNIRPYSETQYE